MKAELATRHSSGATAWRPGLKALLLPALLVIGALFIIPFARLVTSSFSVDGSASLGNYTKLFALNDIFFDVLLRTTWIAALVTVVTIVLGYPLAYLAVRSNALLGAVLLVIVLFPFFTSALVRTYAWRALLADNGPINWLLLAIGIIDSPVRLVYNDIGVVIGMSQVLLPMMVLPLYARMKTIDRSLISAARTMGASPLTAWRTVFLPQSLSGVASGATIVFISALGYYVTPLLLQGPATPLFAQRIDALVALPGRGGDVAAQSTTVLIAALVMMFVFRRSLGLTLESVPRRTRRMPKTLPASGLAAPAQREAPAVVEGASDHSRNLQAWREMARSKGRVGWKLERGLSILRLPVVGVLGVTALAISVVPMVAIVMLGFSNDAFLRFPPTSYSTRWFNSYFSNQAWLDSTWLSVYVAGTAALIAVVLAATASFVIVRAVRFRGAVPSYLALVTPMVIPQVLLAVSLLYFFIQIDIAGRPIALIAAYTLIGLPLASIVLTSAFSNLDPAYEKASATLGASTAMTIRRVILPLVAPSIVAAFIFAFTTGFGDLVFAQFVGGVSTPTLERQMYRSIREEVSPEVAAVGTVMMAALALIAIAFLLASRGTRNQLTSLFSKGKA